jgi:hypothetical protein
MVNSECREMSPNEIIFLCPWISVWKYTTGHFNKLLFILQSYLDNVVPGHLLCKNVSCLRHCGFCIV